MPRIRSTVSEALNKELSAFAASKNMSISQAVAFILAQRLEQPAQDNTWGGVRKTKEKELED